MNPRVWLEMMVCAGLVTTAISCVLLIGFGAHTDAATLTALATIGGGAVGGLGGALQIGRIIGGNKNGTHPQPPTNT